MSTSDTLPPAMHDCTVTLLTGGGYFLGYGNWGTKYIPRDNYLVMLDEARHYAKQNRQPS
ncbi:MAG: hypothetical protein ABR497_00410 [Kiritimatiellia bacterium]|nr:hypothetical protein [Lentisphaerota bacterium]